jgi:hypothetical protein
MMDIACLKNRRAKFLTFACVAGFVMFATFYFLYLYSFQDAETYLWLNSAMQVNRRTCKLPPLPRADMTYAAAAAVTKARPTAKTAQKRALRLRGGLKNSEIIDGKNKRVTRGEEESDSGGESDKDEADLGSSTSSKINKNSDSKPVVADGSKISRWKIGVVFIFDTSEGGAGNISNFL